MLGPSRRRICVDFVTESNKQQKSKKEANPKNKNLILCYYYYFNLRVRFC